MTAEVSALTIARFENQLMRPGLIEVEPNLPQQCIPILARRYAGSRWVLLDQFFSQYDLRRFDVINILSTAGAEQTEDESGAVWFRFADQTA